MKRWFGVALLLAIAVAAAFAWQVIATDPGLVSVRLRGWSVETTAVVAIALLLLLWATLHLMWRLLRWPLRAWNRGQLRRSRERLAQGLTALAEGRFSQAERALGQAAQRDETRASALLALADAAHGRGADERARDVLARADAIAPQAAATVRARHLIKNGQPALALEALEPGRAAHSLPPLGWRLLIEAALQTGDSEKALAALDPLRRSQAFTPAKLDVIEDRVHHAALAGAASLDRLNAIWKSLPRDQRSEPALIAAYARRSTALHAPMAAIDLIESRQRTGWSETLATAWGELGHAELAVRTRTAEGWLKVAPNSPALLATLARLYVEQGDRDRGRATIERALAAGETASGWEQLGDIASASGDAPAAATAYANALRVARGESSQPLARVVARGDVDTHALLVDERDQHGIPLLPRG